MGRLSSPGPTNGWRQPPGAQKNACATYAHFLLGLPFFVPMPAISLPSDRGFHAPNGVGRSRYSHARRASARPAKGGTGPAASRGAAHPLPRRAQQRVAQAPTRRTLHATEKFRHKGERVTHETAYRRMARRHTLAHTRAENESLAASKPNEPFSCLALTSSRMWIREANSRSVRPAHTPFTNVNS